MKLQLKALKPAALSAVFVIALAGCNKTADNTANYKNAIDNFYAGHPACLWPTAQKFPTQVAASDDSQTAPYAALVDQGLLTRTTSEKKIIIISRQEVNYDLSSNGRSAWTADANQPGYGNFCYGHRSVQAIQSSTPNNGQPGATTTVSFTYGFSGAPSWAQSAEVQNAFPQVKADLAGNGNATATLVDTSNGWQVQTPPPISTPGGNPVTPADGKIVQ